MFSFLISNAIFHFNLAKLISLLSKEIIKELYELTVLGKFFIECVMCLCTKIRPTPLFSNFYQGITSVHQPIETQARNAGNALLNGV